MKQLNGGLWAMLMASYHSRRMDTIAVSMHAFTRCLQGFSGAAVGSDSIPSFRKQMLLELHRVKVEDKLQPIQEGEYYSVEYQKAFYIGRVLRNKNATLIIKFLHSVGVKVFDRPKCDDIDDCSPSWLIFGSLQIQGSGPLRFPQLEEVQHVYQYIKRSRKRWTLNYYVSKQI